MPQRGWDTNVWVADNRKLRAELGWQPSYTLDQGIERTVKWFQDNLSRLPLYLEHYDKAK